MSDSDSGLEFNLKEEANKIRVREYLESLVLKSDKSKLDKRILK